MIIQIYCGTSEGNNSEKIEARGEEEGGEHAYDGKKVVIDEVGRVGRREVELEFTRERG